MSLQRTFLPILAVIIIISAGLILLLSSSADSPAEAVAVQPTADSEEEILDKQIKVGQMFLLGIWTREGNGQLLDVIRTGKIGAVILMGQNVGTYEETSQFISDLHATAYETSGLPLIVSVDQEGGIVSRLRFPGFEVTSQPEIQTEAEAYEVGLKRAGDLRGLGINVNFSPVLESISNARSFLYQRTFRSNGESETIGLLGSAMIRGYQDGGIIAVPKHFPGHDDTSSDSHKTLPTAAVSQSGFDAHIAPFLDSLSTNDIQMIMTAHVLFKDIDPLYPATLSEKIIKGILRDKIGYAGVIITDDMEMRAIQDGFGLEESAVQAVKAGNDILLYVSTVERQATAHEAVLEAVKNGEIPESRIDESVRRVVRLKMKISSESWIDTIPE